MNALLFIGITLAASCGVILTVIAIEEHNHFESFDYHLNLDKDSIHIVTDQNQDTTIHFDDLEEYIIWDNL